MIARTPPRRHERRASLASRCRGLDLLATGIVILTARDQVAYMNPAAEHLFGLAGTFAAGRSIHRLSDGLDVLYPTLAQARANAFGDKRVDLNLTRPGREPLELLITVVVLDELDGMLLLECQETDIRLRAAREERLQSLAQENRDLLRNLAHEVKNPLGGIRGAAQLLGLEVQTDSQRECAAIIVKEADRLQKLVDRLLAPHRVPLHIGPLNLHEVCERVRALILAEFSPGLEVMRDYDTSLPDMLGDREQLIQAVLNLARNAAQALQGKGRIELQTRVARQVTLLRQRHKLALELHVIDNGPGIPVEMQERIFLPLVSGREGGTGLGLTLAHSYVQHHGGIVDCDSRPGRTDFRILLPLEPPAAGI